MQKIFLSSIYSSKIQHKALTNTKNLLKYFSQQTQQEPEAVFEQKGKFLDITLNRPHRLNSVNIDMINLIQNKLKQCLENKSVNTFIMKGAGDRAFSSGGDLRSHLDNYLKQDQKDIVFVQQVMEHNFNAFILEYNLAVLRDIVQISLLNGYVMGQGAGLGMFAPIKIATDKTIFAMPEGSIGFFVDAGASYFLTQLKKNLGLYLALTGARVKGIQLYQTGLAHHYVDSTRSQELEKLIQDFSNSKQAQNLQKQDLIQQHNQLIQNFSKQYLPQNADIYQNEDYINEIFEVESLEQLFKNLEKYSHKDFVKEISHQISKSNPWSLYTNFELFQKSKQEKLSIQQCIELDFRLVTYFVARKDFFEGIRCALIDRGATPNWEIKRVFDINRQDVIDQINQPEIPSIEQKFHNQLQFTY